MTTVIFVLLMLCVILQLFRVTDLLRDIRQELRKR